MGLVSETVMVKWHYMNKEWYEVRGYVFTKFKDELEVKVEDLMPNSECKVNVTCDCVNCKNPNLKPMRLVDFFKCVKEDGKYYCRKCSMNLFGSEKIKNTRLKNGTSFEQWCIDNNRQDIILRWDNILNHKLPSEVNFHTKDKFYFKCPLGLHPSELKSISGLTNGNNGSIECTACNSFAEFGISTICSDFLERYWDYEKNDELGINPWKVTYGSNQKVWIKCQEKNYHGSYKVVCNDFKCGDRCGYCSNHRIHKQDSLGMLYPKSILVWSDKNKKSPYEYAPRSNQKVWWKCIDGHEDYYRSIDTSYHYDFRCPECVKERDESFLQEKVRLYLEDLDCVVLHENKCTIIPINPKTKRNLPFDNEVILKSQKHVLIEVHGKQHYIITNFHVMSAKRNNTTPKYELYRQKLHDRYKRIFAKKQGYFYVEIPYWTDNKSEDWKNIIDNKIKEISPRKDEEYAL